MSALVRVACASCDGTVEAEADGAECPWCGVKLHIRREGGAAWTLLAEDAAEVAARADRARRLTEGLRLQRELAMVEGKWIEERALLDGWSIREPRPAALALALAELIVAAAALLALAVPAKDLGVGLLGGALAAYAAYHLAGDLSRALAARTAWREHRDRVAALRSRIDAALRE